MITKSFTVTLGATVVFITTACAAHAGPPPFPDLGNYAVANTADYTIDITNSGRGRLPTVQFLTPDGIPCGFTAGIAGCTSDKLPGIPNAASSQYMFIGTSTGTQPQGSTPYVNNTLQGVPLKVLPPNHSINVDGVICGVDDKGTTACKDPQGRGFILSPSWSGWSAHIG